MRRVKALRLSRRAALRGAGATLALPWLEAMTSRRAVAQFSEASPRVLFIYFPSGYRQGTWLENPSVPGASRDFQLPEIAQALDPFKSKLNVITGLSNKPAEFGNGGDGIHARGTGCYLTCEILSKGGFEVGVSADQVIAQTVGENFCIPSIAAGIPGENRSTFAEDGYGSVYYNNISFTGPQENVQREDDPKSLFNRLVSCSNFGADMPDPAREAAAAERLAFERRVMSSVKNEANQLMTCVGQEDRLRLEQYFTAVSELERRFDEPVVAPPTFAGCTDPTEPESEGATFFESSALMMDTVRLALQCGVTPVSTLMLDGAFSRRSYDVPDIGNVNYIHGLSHGEISGKGTDHPRWMKITTHFFEQFAYLLQAMDAIDEGDGSMLDNSLVFIGSEFGNGDAHSSNQLPLIIVGSGRRKFTTGQHIAVPDETPSANAVLAVMQAAGVQRESFGDSTGSIDGLAV